MGVEYVVLATVNVSRHVPLYVTVIALKIRYLASYTTAKFCIRGTYSAHIH